MTRIPGIARDQEGGVRYIRLAAEKGHEEALAALGLAYEQGRAVPRDYEKANHYYLAATNKGNWRASFLHVRLNFEKRRSDVVDRMGALELPEDFNAIFDWYFANRATRDPAIMNNLGYAYWNALGTERSDGLATIWTVAAAKAGSAIAKGNAKNMFAKLELATLVTKAEMVDGVEGYPAVVAKLAKGTHVRVINEQDGWSLVVNPLTFDSGYVPDVALKVKGTAPQTSAVNGSKWPARPAAVKGAIRCNTNCRNGDCYRTYSDGRKVHFQAKQVWDSLNNAFKWDAGGC